jgi:uncharacterized membrane protein (UPF0127 family)
MTRRLLEAILLAGAVALGGCSPLPVRTVTIAGEPWVVYEGGADGMRVLPGFGDADGMLFDMRQEVDPRGVAFGMEGVGFPMDIAFFDGTGMVVSVATMPTCDAAPCPLFHALDRYRWAVEAPVGAFGDLAPPDSLVIGG